MDVKQWLPEFQVSAESDTHLQSYFLQRPEVDKIINGTSWLVLGRKGVGKTAIYEYLKNSQPTKLNNYNTICINFNDYPWPAHNLYKESLAGELSAYQKSWKYLFYIKALAKLIEIKQTKNEPLNKELKWALKYLNEVYGNPDPTLTEVIISKIIRISKIKGPGVDTDEIDLDMGEISFEDIPENAQLKQKLRSNAFSLLSYFETIFQNNSGQHKIIIALDQLDENWLSGEIEEYSKVLINLLNVCRNISQDFKVNKNLKIITFLRSDIYNSLKFNDKNKLLQDRSVTISWDNDSLDEMFYERIKKYAPKNFDLGESSGQKTSCLFEAKFVRQGTPVFKYVTRRSFFRPRDVIVYLNKVRENHRTNSSGLYTTPELYDADHDASASVYNELIDEWSNQFPEIDDLLSVLQLIQVESFTYDDFVNKHSSIFSCNSPSKAQEHLYFLFNNSIIGQKKQGRWEYVCSTPELKLNIEREFRTHHALKYRLQLLESRPNQNI
ncbi:hypothetical protein [Enterobacter sp. R4-368]|uniref:P-loop ATPase, Sll1717 family n=1 Tax=Enterobacter sp. R4-368 TaxID=1166130 RepID=UPI00034F0A35|nr:hypothetical protein [Enterobacter sp. R4-368]AGN87677.1 hypothetical protein H650_21865 [Enterobacter sp. R4-368]